MTELDKKLIEEANSMSRYDYRQVDALIEKVGTPEARKRLYFIKCELYDLCSETM